LGKTIKELIQTCPDDSQCEIAGELVAPGKKNTINKVNYIAIEGNIGAGKTTLATKISEALMQNWFWNALPIIRFCPNFIKTKTGMRFRWKCRF
jgi:polynucleotide 5'-kinase involved in rRNA processing